MKALSEVGVSSVEARLERPFINSVIAANDNQWPTVLSRETLVAESLLSQIDVIEPRESLPIGLILIGVLCIVATSPLIWLGL